MTYSKFIKASLIVLSLAAPIAAPQMAFAQQVFTTDVIIQGSLCVGLDCASGESFGFDTLRLKENNLRINFDDTSASAAFPSNDWRLIINDSTNGGADYFAVEDATAGRMPFQIRAGAPTNSLFVSNSGNVGFGTATPVLEAHIVDGDTPSVRLEQDGSSGFTAQTWDVAGNETNFFVRDATTGSKLVFRVLTGARYDGLVLAADSQVGIGTSNPNAALHIVAAGDNAGVKLDNGTIGVWDMVVRNSDGEFAINDSSTTGGDFIFKTADSLGNTPWEFVHRVDDGFGLNTATTAGAEFILSNTGNLTVSGTITSGGPICSSGCDAVFDADYEMPTIEEQAEAMFAARHLPAVGPTRPDQPINLTEHMGNVLNELEKAHIFIAQLNERNKSLEARLERLESSRD
ncbi:hypothetical protein [Robiginitomaculum antarcticum]|uniref:hypothetical protein n=1 Tax=Robiginitomaculum antarcticum TaxID=437507 RepID=UPI00037D08D9|nr:hypothetical protein [Robiginitomaculum antarcticum]